jgi:pimeloyl-ACP methyl ester carboxylesterase
MLEAIVKGNCSPEHPSPLLFVHGAWHAAWCWDEHFLDLFAEKGYRAIAVNLRAHGGRLSDKRLHRHSIADYVEDVVAIADGLPSPPIVIGHSMGGMIVQNYLQSHRAPAAVLVASAPPQGALPFLKRWMKQRPARFVVATVTGKTIYLLNTPELVRQKMLSSRTPEAVVVACAERLQNESRRTSQGMVTRLPRPGSVDTTILVLGAELDACFTPDEVRATARFYGTEAVIFPEMGHDMMLEPGWRSVAEHIDAWLVGQGL